MVTVLNKQLTELTGESSYTVNGFNNYPLYALEIYGKSVQNGTPTPATPIDIVSVGDDGNVEIISGFSVADNVMLELGGVDGNGLNTENSTRMRSKNYIAVKPNTRYTITAKHNTIKGNLKIHLSFYSTNDYSTNRIGLADWRNGNSYDFITPSNANYVRILFGIDGSTANVALSLDDVYNVCVFEDVVATITSGLPLCSIDSVKDELIYNADGTGKIIKRTAKIDSYNREAIATDYISSTGGLDTGAKVIYVLENPIEIELTAAEMAKLQQLRTLEGVTNIYNTDNGEMYVRAMTAGFEYGHEVGFFNSKI